MCGDIERRKVSLRLTSLRSDFFSVSVDVFVWDLRLWFFSVHFTPVRFLLPAMPAANSKKNNKKQKQTNKQIGDNVVLDSWALFCAEFDLLCCWPHCFKLIFGSALLWHGKSMNFCKQHSTISGSFSACHQPFISAFWEDCNCIEDSCMEQR
jgi:hypothetical protein